MSVEAPERIWVWPPLIDEMGAAVNTIQQPEHVEYVRADKLEELAAENERARRERVEANNEWRKAYNELTVKTEAALAEAKRKNETLTYQNEVQRALIKELRNAGGSYAE